MRKANIFKKLLTLSSIMLLLLSFSCSSNDQSEDQKEHEQQWKKINAAVEKAYRNGNYQKGIELAEKAYQYAKKHLGRQNPSILQALNNLAILYDSQGRYAEAEPLYKEALQLRKKELGKEHPDTLTSIKDLVIL